MWSYKKCVMVSLRLGTFAAVLFGLFWGVWSFFAPVPVVAVITLMSGVEFSLPFCLSRYTDVIFAPLLVGILVTTCGRTEWEKDFALKVVILTLLLFFGLESSFFFGLGAGIIVVFVISLLTFGIGFIAICLFSFFSDIVAFTKSVLFLVLRNLKPFFLYLFGNDVE